MIKKDIHSCPYLWTTYFSCCCTPDIEASISRSLIAEMYYSMIKVCMSLLYSRNPDNTTTFTWVGIFGNGSTVTPTTIQAVLIKAISTNGTTYTFGPLTLSGNGTQALSIIGKVTLKNKQCARWMQISSGVTSMNSPNLDLLFACSKSILIFYLCIYFICCITIIDTISKSKISYYCRQVL